MKEKSLNPLYDSSVTPIAGCGGCELYARTYKTILASVRDRLRICRISPQDFNIAATLLVDLELRRNIQTGRFDPAHHSETMLSSQVYELRYKLARLLSPQAKNSEFAYREVIRTIEEHVACPVARLHALKGYSVFDMSRQGDPRLADNFTKRKKFPGVVEKAAALPDLINTRDPAAPWINDIPRLILIGESGDALSDGSVRNLKWLSKHVIEPMRSENGLRHIFLWMTRRPQKFHKLAEIAEGLPKNLCVMTAITTGEPKEMQRIEALKNVDALARAVSFDPMLRRIPPRMVDLEGIDWVIVGGERGGRTARPFDVNWALEMGEHCRTHDVPMFISQLGKKPHEARHRLPITSIHGQDWNEWPYELCVREFPKAFHTYRELPGEPAGERPGLRKPTSRERLRLPKKGIIRAGFY